MDASLERIIRLIENNWNKNLREKNEEEKHLWDVQREALERIYHRLATKKAVGIVQMPTGSGKSVVMAFTIGLLSMMSLPEEERDIVLVLAPLNRIKFQLWERFEEVLTGNTFLKVAMVDLSSSNRARMNETKAYPEGLFWKVLAVEENSVRKKFKELMSTWINHRESLYDLPTRYKLLVVFLHPMGLRSLYNKEYLFRKLKSRLLAIIMDEVHYGYSGGDGSQVPYRSLVEDLLDEVQIAIGFSATPIRDNAVLLCPHEIQNNSCGDAFIYRKSCIDLSLESWGKIVLGERPILIPKVKAYFYNTELADLDFLEEDPNKFWNYAIEDRVKKYIEKLKEVLRRETADLRHLKTMVLAPNTREADLWEEKLRKEFPDVKVMVAHSNRKDRDPLDAIKDFVDNHSSGVLVAVDMTKLGFDDPNLDLLVIARPTKSPVAYVQMRGRVARWPSRDSFKRRRGYALLIHMAAESPLEREEVIRRAEEALCETTGIDFIQSESEGVIREVDAEVRVRGGESATLFDEEKLKKKIIRKVIIPFIKDRMVNLVKSSKLRFEEDRIVFEVLDGFPIRTEPFRAGDRAVEFAVSLKMLYRYVISEVIRGNFDSIKSLCDAADISLKDLYGYLDPEREEAVIPYNCILEILNVKTDERRSSAETRTISLNVRELVNKVIAEGSENFTYGGAEIKLEVYVNREKNRRYIVVYKNGREKGRIRIRGGEGRKKTVNALRNILRDLLKVDLNSL